MTNSLIKLEQYEISKETTAKIKGIAIILMIIHHFLAYPFWLIDGVTYPNVNRLGEDLNVWIECSTKICVSIFAFITGYGYYLRNNQTIKYGLKKIFNFLEKYWFILFIIFIPIILIIGEEEINLTTILLNLFAIDERIIYFAWYVYFYIFAMLTLPLLKKISNNNFLHDLIIMVGICVVGRNLLAGLDIKDQFVIEDIKNCFFWMPCVIIGWLFAKYHLFNKINKVFKSKNKLTAILITVFVLGARLKWEELMTVNLDIIYAPMIMYSLSYILKDVNIFGKILKFFNANSINLWFLHSIFFSPYTENVFQPYLYISTNPIIVVLWGILLCLPVSILINLIFKLKNKIIRKIKKKKSNKVLNVT